MQQIRGLKVVTRYTYAPSTKLSHCDLSSTICQFIKSIPLSWKFCHMKGCQDGSDTYNNIDELGQMNIEADILARYFMWRKFMQGQPTSHIKPYLELSNPQLWNITTSHTLSPQICPKQQKLSYPNIGA